MQIFHGAFLDQSDSPELAPKLAPIEPSAPFQPTRAGVGEYFHPTKYNKPAIYGRYEFLRKIEEVAPEVLEGLVISVRPHYEPLRAELGEYDLLTLSSASIRQRIATGQANLAALNSALHAWSLQFHLDADWMRDFALNTLLHWTGQRIVIGISPGWTFSGGPTENPLTNAEKEFGFSHHGWEMTYTTKNDFMRNIRSEFEKTLKAYVARAEQKAQADGWKQTPALRKSGKDKDVFRNVEWLVRWQVQEWESSRIATEYALGKQRAKRGGNARSASVTDTITTREERTRKSQSGYKSVHDAITKAAKLIELPLRRAMSSSSAS